MSEEAENTGPSHESAAASAASRLVAALQDGGVSMTADNAMASMALAAAAAVGLVSGIAHEQGEVDAIGDGESVSGAAAADFDDAEDAEVDDEEDEEVGGIDEEGFDAAELETPAGIETAAAAATVMANAAAANAEPVAEDGIPIEQVATGDSAATTAAVVPTVPAVATEPSMSCDNVPDFAVLCSFLDRFGALLGITPTIKEVQIMLEQQGNVSEQLIDIHIKLLRKIVTSATKNRFDRYLARYCEMYLIPYDHQLVVQIMEHGYAKLDLVSKVHILKNLLEMQFDFNSKFKSQANDRSPEELRMLPLGRDADGIVYWLQVDEDLNVRMYIEDLDDESSFHLLHKTKEELADLLAQLKKLKDDNFQKQPASSNNTSSSEPSPKSTDEAVKQEDQKANIVSAIKVDIEIKAEQKIKDENIDAKPRIDKLKKETNTEADTTSVVKSEPGSDKKELVEDLCTRQSDSSRSSGEGHPVSAKVPVSKLENEAHCAQPCVKTESLTASSVVDGSQPEAAHSASAGAFSMAVVIERADKDKEKAVKEKKPLAADVAEERFDEECEDAKATDLSLPHLPTPPHEQEQRLPAAPQTAVHSPPVPPKKPQSDGDYEDDKEMSHHAAEDLRTSEKKTTTSAAAIVDSGGDSREDPGGQLRADLEGIPVEDTKKARSKKGGDEKGNGQMAEELSADSDDEEELMDTTDSPVSRQKDREKSSRIEQHDDVNDGETEDNTTNDATDVQEKQTPKYLKKSSLSSARDEQVDENLTQVAAEDDSTIDKNLEGKDDEATRKVTQESGKDKDELAEEEAEEQPKPKKRGRGRPRKGQGRGRGKAKGKPAVTKKPAVPKPPKKKKQTDDGDQDGTGHEDDEEIQKENVEEKPKKRGKMSREARMLLEEAERRRAQEDDEDGEFGCRPRRSCRARKVVEKYEIPVSEDESKKKKRKSKADKEEEKEIVFSAVGGINAKAARKAAREMIKAQKLAHKELMKKLKGKKKRGRKGAADDSEDDDDNMDSVEELIYGHDEDDDADKMEFGADDEDEFACDEDIADGTLEAEEVKKARTATHDDADACKRCLKSDHPEFILLCDTCDAGWHMNCLRPPLLVIPLGNWYCPPCEHNALIAALDAKINYIESEWEKRQKEITRKQRLAFVSINIGNVLPVTKREVAKKSFTERYEDDESDISEVDSSSDDSDSSGSSASSSNAPRRRRAARKGDAMREKMLEYDKLMKEAIDDDEFDEEIEEERTQNVKRRSGKDMSNILPDSDEEKKVEKTGRRRRSKLSDLNAMESADDDSEFQASDYSGEIEVNRRKKGRTGGGSRRRRYDSDDMEDSEALSDASWGRANIRSGRKSSSRRKRDPFVREKTSKKGGRWDDFDSEASQSFKASSDDSGDFCKPRKRQAVNYAESSDESEKEKAEKPSRRRKVIESDEEVALEDSDSDEEQDDDDELSDEDASNDESDSDDSDSDDSDEEDSDGNVTRRKKGKSKKRAEKERKKIKDKRDRKEKLTKTTLSTTSRGDSLKVNKGKSSLSASAKTVKRKKRSDDDDSVEDEEDSDSWGPSRKQPKGPAKKSRNRLESDDDGEDIDEEEDIDDTAGAGNDDGKEHTAKSAAESNAKDKEGDKKADPSRRTTNGRAEANKARERLVHHDDYDEGEDLDEDEDDDEIDEDEDEGVKAWPPLPSHLMANIKKDKKLAPHLEPAKSELTEGKARMKVTPIVPRAVPETLKPASEKQKPAPVKAAVGSPVKVSTSAAAASAAVVAKAAASAASTITTAAAAAAQVAGIASSPSGQILPAPVSRHQATTPSKSHALPVHIGTAPTKAISTGNSPSTRSAIASSQILPPGYSAHHPLAHPGLAHHNNGAALRPTFPGHFGSVGPGGELGPAGPYAYQPPPGYGYGHPSYGYHPQLPPGYPSAAYSGVAFTGDAFAAEWGPSGPQAQAVAQPVAVSTASGSEEKGPSEHFSISNILQQGENAEDMDSVASIGNLMGK